MSKVSVAATVTAVVAVEPAALALIVTAVGVATAAVTFGAFSNAVLAAASVALASINS